MLHAQDKSDSVDQASMPHSVLQSTATKSTRSLSLVSLRLHKNYSNCESEERGRACNLPRISVLKIIILSRRLQVLMYAVCRHSTQLNCVLLSSVAMAENDAQSAMIVHMHK